MPDIIVREYHQVDYTTCFNKMRQFTIERDTDTIDEIWIVEHPAVFTQGQAGKPEHILNPKEIPIIQSDRGGQITYHGPGQIIIYTMLNLHKLNIGIRKLVCTLEKSVIDYLAEFDISAQARRDAPGVYIDNAKICSLGLRVKRGCTYHGLAFNYDMDLEPFQRINPCGYSNLAVTQLKHFVHPPSMQQVSHSLCQHITKNLGYTNHTWK